MTAKTDPAKMDNAVSLYISGKSAYEIQATTGVQRNSLRAELIRRGIEPRGRSSAGKLRASKMTDEQRAAQCAAAHLAATGRKKTWAEQAKRAASRESNPPAMSIHESTFANMLTDKGIPWRREVAVDIYNVDFTIGSVAVEILGGEWHAYKGERHPRRIKEILNAGWSLIYLWSTTNHPITAAAAEYCIAYAQQVSRNPSLIGEYRVIRGDAHLITAGRGELDQFALEQSARDSVKRTPSELAAHASSIRWQRYR